MAWWRRLWSRNVRAQERAEEIRAHLDLYAEERMARGWSADDARRQARLKFGNPRVKLEEVDALNGWHWFDALRLDLRLALRSLRAAPGFTTVVLAVLTLGIGASTAIFSVVDAVVLRGLPFDASDRLVGVSRVNLRDGSLESAGFDAPDATDYRRRQDVFADLAAVPEGPIRFTLRGDQLEHVYGTRSTADLFAVLGVRPQLGRAFSSDNEIQGNHRVVLISDGLWHRRFGADPDIVGKTMITGTITREILGVMPRGFTYPIGVPERVDLWVPWVTPENENSRDGGRVRYLSLVGRLKAGVSVDQAQARMAQITASLTAEYPAWFKDQGVDVRPLVDAVVGDRVASWMLMLLGAVVCVLLIACVNVANLLLARATARSHDIRIRSALGASRWQLIRGMLVESLLLSIAGTALAVVFAFWAVQLLRAAMPADVPRLSSVAVDLRVIAGAALAALVCGVLTGLGPALHLSQPQIAGAFRESRQHTARSQRLRGTLIVLEVALAVVMLVGSGLFVSSFVRLTSVDLGFDYRSVLTFPVYPRIDLSSEQATADTYARADALVSDVLDRLRTIPGVESAASVSGGLPLTSSWSRAAVEVSGRTFTSDEAMVDIHQATPDYLAVMRLNLLQGRWLAPTDTRGSAPVVVLNDEAARRYLGDVNPIGAEIRLQNRVLKVVGVVRGVRLGGPESDVRPEAYVSPAQSTIIGGAIVVRTAGLPPAIVPAVRTALTTITPPQSLSDVTTLEEIFGGLVAARRFNMMLLSLFGLLGIVIAAIGIYGVMAYLVTQRTREIGVRMALGADAWNVQRSVLGQACRYLVLGLSIGLASASSLSTLVEGFLFRVSPRDIAVYAAAGAVILVAGLMAAWLPARRASHVDPLVALRAE
jgi:putative ABC transport system permease protein